MRTTRERLAPSSRGARAEAEPEPYTRRELEALRERAAALIWPWRGGKGKHPEADGARQRLREALAAVLAVEAAVETARDARRPQPKGWKARHLRAVRAYFAAHAASDMPAIVVAEQLAVWLLGNALDAAERRVAERWLTGVVGEVERRTHERATRQAAGRERAEQRRAEAEHHRAEYRAMVAAAPDDPPTREQAAAVIVDDCRRAGRRCCRATVRDHLKTA
jgi:hypothetical protein